MAEFKLPEGYSLEPPKFKLPEGYSLEPPKEDVSAVAAPTRTPRPEVAQMDPNEIAAMRLAQGVTRQEGPLSEKVGAFVRGIPGAVGGTIQRAMEGATALSGGELTPEEKRQAVGQIFEGATLTGGPASVARGAGAGVRAAREAIDPVHRAAGIGVQIPKGLERFPRIYEFLSRIPIVGTPARQASSRAATQIEEAGRRATELPAGRGVIVEEGGDILRNTVNSAEAGGQIMAGTGIGRMSKEGAIDTLINHATSGDARARATLGNIRGAHAARDWEVVSGSMLNRMGQGQAGWDPAVFGQAWSRLDPQAKAMLFPKGTAKHIDTIVETNNKYGAALERTAARPAIGGGTMALGTAVGAMLSPMTTLAAATGMGMRGVTAAMSKPAVAASMANWTRMYDKLLSTPGPAALAAFSNATRNLAHNLGEDGASVRVQNILRYVKDNLPNVELQL